MTNAEDRFVFREPSVNSKNVVKRDEQTISPSYTRSYGFTVSHGEGAEVWDVDGNRYIDFASGIAVLSTGFSHPRIVKAVQEQVAKYMHIGGTDFFSPEPVRLAEKLQDIIPIHNAEPDEKLVYYGNSGTESVEAAIKLARYATKRSHIVAFYGAFHGRTMGSLSLTASKYTQRDGYPYVPGGVTHVPYPARNQCDDCDDGGSCCSQCWCDAVGFIEKFVFKKVAPSDVAAIIVEPIQGEGGYLVPRDDFLPNLRALCDKHGILLIVDEIQSGVGRTGKWLAIEHWDVSPDIVCLAKGLGSGLPIGAVVAHRDIMGEWIPGAHASTFGGNPVACVAALETLNIIEEGLLDSVSELGNYTYKRLSAFMQDHPSMSRVDGKGFMLGMDFVDADGEPLPAFRDEIVNRCYLNGLLTLACGTSGIRFAPALIINRELIDEGLDILEHCIASVEEDLWTS